MSEMTIEQALRWLLSVARGTEWQPDGNGGPNKCFTCGAYSSQGHKTPCERFDRFVAAENTIRLLTTRITNSYREALHRKIAKGHLLTWQECADLLGAYESLLRTYVENTAGVKYE